MKSSKIQILNSKIRNFLRKYYLNKLYKGIAFFVIILLATFIAFSLFEYFSYSNTVVRSILFYSFLALAAGIGIAYIIIPSLKIAGLGKQLTNEEVAKIVGDHFEEIDDKLLNLFELQKQMERGDYASYDLLSAAIDSKVDSLKTYSFVQAIPVKNTKRIALWMLLPIAIFLLLFSIKKELFTEPTKRIVHYSEVYEKPAPYSFVVTNESLKAFQYEDYTVNVKVEGSEVPDEVYIKYKNRNYKCQKNANSEFSYTFTNVQQNTEFQINTEEVTSTVYEIEVLPKPVMLGFNLSLHYPSYLNKPDEVLENVSNVTVPEGTKITWNFVTRNSENLILLIDGNEKVITSDKDNYIVSVTARNSFSYSILNKNRFMTGKDTLTDEVTVIKDMYPDIYVQSQQDSAYHDRVYFKGNIKDDYGFSKLQFVYNKLDKDGKVISSGNAVPIKIQNNVTIQDFYYYFDQVMFNLNPGEQIEYYFQVYDNDGVNGAKSTKSTVQSYKVRTMEEIEHDLQQAEEQTKSEYSDLLKESQDLAKEIEKMQQKMRQEKDLSWQDKKNLEKLMKDYQKLQDKINELKQQQENHQQVENQYKNVDEDILRKQEELQKRMDEILSDEMKQMMKELEQMMQQNLNKDQIQQQMEKMKLSTKDINESLDQQLQLYKQLEVEKKLKDAVQNMHDLADELRKNAEKTENKQNSNESLQKSHQELQKKYDQIKKDIEDLKKLNSELEDPTKFKDTQELQKDADQNMQQSKQNLDKNNRSKSADNQKKAADDIDQMAEQLEQDFNESELESITEDIATIRQILDNLVKVSFDQEDIMKRSQKMSSFSSQVSDVMKKQFEVKQNMTHIEDSLNALARRQAAVKPFIQKEVSKIQSNIESAQSELQNRRMSNASKNQQFALTSMNNLALMLMESMKDMQEQQQKSESKCNKSGNGSCNKPGGKGKSKKTSARELQQQLNRQMEAMKKSMEQQGKQGQTGQQQNMSEQFAKMAAQQEAIRKMLQDYQSELKQQNGVGDRALDKIIEDMQKTEKELVNRQITQQTINRQKDITTRMLQSERADMEREKDKERKSNEARQVPNINPPKEWNFDRQQIQQNEMLRSVPANLNYYYKSKANNYFYNIE